MVWKFESWFEATFVGRSAGTAKGYDLADFTDALSRFLKS
jgi:hypothetical protein